MAARSLRLAAASWSDLHVSQGPCSPAISSFAETLMGRLSGGVSHHRLAVLGPECRVRACWLES